LSDDVILDVRGLSGPAGRPFIQEVDLVVHRGETRVVIGQIHAGKSMIMRHILGLDPAESGTVRVGSESFHAARPDPLAVRSIRTRIGSVFEGSALVTRLTVIENVELPLLEHTDASAAEARETARELLAEVGLIVDDDIVPAELGRAEQRRVALARALALSPPILLLDEPSHGLDSHAAAELDATIARLQEVHGFGVLTFTNEVRHAFGPADYIYILAAGRIVAGGDRDTLLASEDTIVRSLLHRRERE
jgi:phospholipid/cholesterol/gamma-HCH transport system ATP-binding protein